MGRLLVMTAGLVAMALLIAAWSGFERDPSAMVTDALGRGAFRLVVNEDVITLNPQDTSSLTDFRMITALFEGLTGTDASDLSTVPGVAESLPTVSDDGRVYTFKLRSDARWSNGDAVTAGDFHFAWKRAMTPDFAAIYTGLFHVIRGAKDAWDWREAQLASFPDGGKTAEQAWAEYELYFKENVGIEVVDDLTLRVTLAQPTAYFTELCAFGSLSPNHEKSVRDAITLDAKTGRAMLNTRVFTEPGRLVSNGPYMLGEWLARRRMVLDQNPHYWGRDAMANVRVVQSVVQDNGPLAMAQYLDGEHDWVPVVGGNNEFVVKVAESGRPDVQIVPQAGVEYYSFNNRATVDGRANVMSDVRVRRAISLAIDRQAIVDRVMRKGEPVAGGFVPAGAVRGYESPADAAIAFDVEEARRLLAEAGYPGGKGLPTLRLLVNANAGRQQIAVRVANQLNAVLGVRCEIEAYEWRVYLDRRRKGQFDFCRAGWYGDYQDPTTWLDLYRSNDPNNETGYASAAYDGLLAQAAAETDPLKRLRILADAERVLLNDHVLVPLFQPVALTMYDPAGARPVDERVEHAEPGERQRAAPVSV